MKVLIRPILLIVIIFLIKSNIYTQTIYYPLNQNISINLENLMMDSLDFHTGAKPYNMEYSAISDSSVHVLFFPQSLFKKRDEKYFIRSSPVFSLVPALSNNENGIINNYLTGLSFSGSAGTKFAFRLNAFAGVRSFPEILENKIDSTESMPAFGRFLSKHGKNYLFTGLTGYLSYTPFKMLCVDLGIDQHFWGDGYRTLFLSDNSPAFPYIQTKVEFWRLKYSWLFGLLFDKNSESSDNQFKPKFLFAHNLSYNVTKWLNLDFFEGLVSNPIDSAGIFRLEPAYLNPVIFMRPVEFASGSTDNVILGFGFKLKSFRKTYLYSQLLFDEFILSEIRSGNDWWGNKYGFQFGLKAFDLCGIENLFWRLEYNKVRPYTYSYYSSFGNYGSFYSPLAHPIGANFRELIFEARYHFKHYFLSFSLVSGTAGTDTGNESYGQDIYKSSKLRPGDYGIKQGQGQKGNYLDACLNFEWFSEFKIPVSPFISAKYRKYENFGNQANGTFLCIGLRCPLLNERLAEFF